MRHQGKIVGICIASNRKGHLLKFKNQKLKILRKKQQTMSFSFMSIKANISQSALVFVIVSATIDIFLRAVIKRTNLPFCSKFLRS